ncbi:MAG: phytoene/squalene synthase family protein [Pacificimonas sp.]|jgi:phytoene synthase|nr:phytoene/squalene synthase family protein [Pacificimonas sp.]
MTPDLDRWAARSIAKGSKSFALASLLFDAETKRRVRLLYAWCRHCDDVVDGQEGGRRGVPLGAAVESEEAVLARLAELRERTRRGLADPASETGAFAAIGLVAAETGMAHDLPMRHLKGFAMDAYDRRYTRIEDTLDYCEHVAGVVGRMMAVVMGVSPEDEALMTRAADLGLAFQLTNICRDIVEDAANDRCYLPTEWLVGEDIAPGDHARPENRFALTRVAEKMLTLADRYYASASEGAAYLPPRAAWAVLTAEKVYRAIGEKVRAAGPDAWDERQYTTKLEKLRMLAAARKDVKAAGPAEFTSSARGDLWTYDPADSWREPEPMMAVLDRQRV